MMTPSETITSLVAAPVRLSLGLLERGLSGALTVTRTARELLEPAGPPGQPSDVAFPDDAESFAEPPASEPFAEPPASEPLVTEEPAHLDDDDELVAEVAEPGAEDGAGAEVHVDEPWPGYDAMSAAEVRRRLESDGHTLAAAVVLYEGAGRARTTVIEAAERRLR